MNYAVNIFFLSFVMKIYIYNKFAENVTVQRKCRRNSQYDVCRNIFIKFLNHRIKISDDAWAPRLALALYAELDI